MYSQASDETRGVPTLLEEEEEEEDATSLPLSENLDGNPVPQPANVVNDLTFDNPTTSLTRPLQVNALCDSQTVQKDSADLVGRGISLSIETVNEKLDGLEGLLHNQLGLLDDKVKQHIDGIKQQIDVLNHNNQEFQTSVLRKIDELHKSNKRLSDFVLAQAQTFAQFRCDLSRQSLHTQNNIAEIHNNHHILSNAFLATVEKLSKSI